MLANVDINFQERKVCKKMVIFLNIYSDLWQVQKRHVGVD